MSRKVRIPFWLIQTGDINHGHTASLNDFVKLRYMGAAEFEFGGLDASLGRILTDFQNYSIKETEVKSLDGKRLVVFTKDKRVPAAINRFVFTDIPDKILFFKCPSYLERIPSHNAGKDRVPNFWMCIDSSYYSIYRGDWIAFFEDDADDFMKVIEHEKSVWNNKTKEERENILKNR